MKRVLLLSAYEARSHLYWRQMLQGMFPDWHWHVLTLPPRHFNWRVRGNPLYWASEEREALIGDYDVVLATSMVDLATLRGLVPELTRTLNCLYFHENQFAYPQNAGQGSALESQMVSLYSAMAADRVVFNSDYNRRTFLSGAQALLKKLPDYVPDGLVESIDAKSRILPVPIQQPGPDGTAIWPGEDRGEGAPVRLVWLGRFEYDKGPEVLLHTLHALERSGLSYELALVGQQFRSSPLAFDAVRDNFAHRLVHCGFIQSDTQFRALLRAADFALSTALHEFQGLALLEAAAHGAIPVVPARQAYPEVFPQMFCYPIDAGDAAGEGQAAAGKLQALLLAQREGELQPPSVASFFPDRIAGQYRRLFEL